VLVVRHTISLVQWLKVSIDKITVSHQCATLTFAEWFRSLETSRRPDAAQSSTTTAATDGKVPVNLADHFPGGLAPRVTVRVSVSIVLGLASGGIPGYSIITPLSIVFLVAF